MNRAIKIALLALAFLPLTYLAEAAISLSFVPRASASLPSGLFVDPRDFTATCDGDTTGAHDDAPGFRLALATHLPVVIPYPGCEWITQVPAIKNGDKIFSFGGSGPYDDLGSGTTPRIFIPSNVAATNNCAFDVAGFEGVTLENVTFNGWDRDIGTVAICNSGGVGGGRPQAFTHIINVSCSNVGTCIGAPTLEVASSDPTYCNIDTSGGLNTPVFQMDIRGLMTGHVCWSIYANFSDTHIDSIYMANNYNSCIAADTGAGVLLEIVNLRCEYSGHFDGHAVVLAGASIYIAGFGKAHLTNGFFDHTFGSCVTVDGADNGSGSQVAFTNLDCNNAGTGGAVSDGGVIPDNDEANFVLKNQVAYLSATGISAEAFTTLIPHNLSFVGTQSAGVFWQQSGTDGPNGGGGWRVAEFNGTLPVSFNFQGPGLHIINDLPGSCGAAFGLSSLPTGTQWSNSNVVTACP